MTVGAFVKSLLHFLLNFFIGDENMNKKAGIKEKLAHHSLAIISLIVAIIALTYNTWRSDTTETNRNIRTASFEMIRELGELQNITNQLHYSLQAEDKIRDQLLINGWGHIALIEDLSALLPDMIAVQSQKLKQEWQNNYAALGQADAAEKAISDSIAQTRQATRNLLQSLE